MRFTWGDAIMFGVLLLAAAVCGIFAIFGKPLEGQIVSGLTGAMFGIVGPAVLLVIRYKASRCAYRWRGVLVILGEKNAPPRMLVQMWIDHVFKCVTQKWGPKAIKAAADGARVIFLDVEKISAFGRFFRGYAWNGDAVVGYRNPGNDPKWPYQASLVKEEFGHVMLRRLGVPDQDQHRLLDELKIT